MLRVKHDPDTLTAPSPTRKDAPAGSGNVRKHLAPNEVLRGLLLWRTCGAWGPDAKAGDEPSESEYALDQGVQWS